MELDLELPVQVTSSRPVGQDVGPDLHEPVTIRTELTAALLALLTGTTSDTTSDSTPLGRADTPAGGADAVGNATGRVAPVGTTEADETAHCLEPWRQVDPSGASEPTAPSDAKPADPDPEPNAEPDLEPEPAERVRPRDGVTELVGYGPADPELLSDLLRDPHGLPVGLSRVTIRRICVDPLGVVVAVDDTALPLHRLLQPSTTTRTGDSASGSGAAGSGAGGTVTAAELLGRLTADLPTPPPPVPTYQPSAAQRRLIRLRTPRCCWPGCPRPADTCDLDHRRRHPDGQTTTANLHPLCRHHHRLKHAGWRHRTHPDGTTTWTSPTGLPRTTSPP